MFGAKVFSRARAPPERVQIDSSVRPAKVTGRGFVCPFFVWAGVAREKAKSRQTAAHKASLGRSGKAVWGPYLARQS